MADARRARLPMTLAAAGDTHIGRRPHNEDTILVRPDLKLFAVADGAGGHNAGNVAASLATTTIAHFLEKRLGEIETQPPLDRLGLRTAARRLAMAVQMANREILGIAKKSERHRGMGTTIVAGLFRLEEGELHLAFVGDSRCYRMRAGHLERLTHDHSFVNDVLEMRPDIEDDRVLALPQNVVTRALGMSSRLRVSVRTYALDHGDRYLFCSDGLSDVASEEQIAEALSLHTPCEEVARLLLELPLASGGQDNIAVLVVDCSPGASYGAVVRPTKVMGEPPPQPSPLQQEGGESTEESVPEIMMVAEPPPETRDPRALQVVPSDSATAAVVEAMEGVMKPPGLSLPRRHKPEEEPVVARSGSTDKPPPPSLEPPPLDDGPPQSEITRRGLPVPPPPRGLEHTRDFTNEAIACPACGGVVAADARRCRNCGAEIVGLR